MFSREELKEMAKLHGNGTYFVSLYLNVNPVTNPKGEFAIRFKNMLRETTESLEKPVLKEVKEDLSLIDAYLLGNKRGFKKGLALLSSKKNSFWREYHVSVPLRSELVVDKTPYLKPLIDMLDNYKRYAALLVDKEAARIFVVQTGEVTEYGEVHTPDVPGKHKKGGWFALSQNHYERHIDYHVGLHLKDVVKKFGAFLKGEYIGRVLIGGSEEAVSMTRGLLPKAVTDRIIGTFHAGMFEGNADILKKVEPLLAAYERDKEKETVGELIAKTLKNEKAVLGADDVLGALSRGNLMKLVLLRDFATAGYTCASCGMPFTRRLPSCPYCKGPMEEVGYMADLIAQKAVEQGAPVEVVAESEELKKAGGIGAFLRF